MARLASILLGLMLALGVAGCDKIHGVSTKDATNVQGAPGTAADTATGGQGNSFNQGDVP